MPDNLPQGDWLLLDAAGPLTLAAVLRNGDWLRREASDAGSVEALHALLRRLLGAAGLDWSDLAGVLYARGPGSTLGLRLAALFIRGLQELPPLRHWRCLQYQNLELACASLVGPGRDAPAEAAAPWRAGHLHHVRFAPGAPGGFVRGAVTPQEVSARGIPVFGLGKAGNWPGALPYPDARIPELLGAFPQLLEAGPPTPYLCEEPSFARWSAGRHRAS